MNNRIIIEPQLSTMDCGPSCLKSICTYYGIDCSITLLRELCNTAIDGTSLYGLSNAAQQVGLLSRAYQLNVLSLINMFNSPSIILWKGNHFMVLYNIKRIKNETFFMCANPAGGKKIKLSLAEFTHGFCSINGNEGIILKFGIDRDNQCVTSYKILKKNSIFKPQTFAFFKKIQNTVHANKKSITKAIIATFAIMVIQFAFPFLTKNIFDKGVTSNDTNLILLILLAQFVLEGAQFLFSFIRNFILLHVGIGTNIKIIGDYLRNLLSIKMKFLESNFCGDIIQRINDHYKIQYFLTDNALDSIFAILSLIVFGIVLCIYSRLVFFIFFMGGILYVIWILLFIKRREIMDNKLFSLNSSHQSIILQFIHGMAEIRLNLCGKRKINQWEKLQKDLKESHVENMRLSQWQQSGSIFINQSKNLLISAISAIGVINGELTIGTMIAIQYIVGMLNGPVNQIVTSIKQYQTAMISFKRLTDASSLPHEDEGSSIENIDNQQNNDIILDNVSFKYNSEDNECLSHINLKIKYGLTTAIVGSSGSGKSTLMKLLLGFYEPNSGAILIGKTDLNTISKESWRKNCGVVMQEGYIFSESILQNIALGEEDPNQERVIQAAKVANIHNDIEQMPLEYNTIIGNDGKGLSLGQKQRLLIARAIYKNPRYFFMDEATNSLDTTNERNIVESLSKEYPNTTFIIIAHRLSTIKNADQIVVLDNGKIVEVGTHSDLINMRGKYYQLIKNQL